MNVATTLISLCACLGAGAALAGETPAPESGVWVKRSYTLQYMGFTSTYSCDGLADKLRLLVRAAGARSDIKSSAGACASGFGRPDKFASATVTFYALVPVAQAKADEADGTQATGAWQSVELATHKPHDLQTGDCELIEQFRDHVLPLFAQRLGEQKITCVPNQQSGSGYFLRFDVFKPVAAVKP